MPSDELYAFARKSLILVKALTTFTNLYLLTQFRCLTQTKTGDSWAVVSFAFAYRSGNNKENCLENRTFFAVCHAALFLIVMLHESCDNSPPGIEHFRKVPASFQARGWSGLISPFICIQLFISVSFLGACYFDTWL